MAHGSDARRHSSSSRRPFVALAAVRHAAAHGPRVHRPQRAARRHDGLRGAPHRRRTRTRRARRGGGCLGARPSSARRRPVGGGGAGAMTRERNTRTSVLTTQRATLEFLHFRSAADSRGSPLTPPPWSQRRDRRTHSAAVVSTARPPDSPPPPPSPPSLRSEPRAVRPPSGPTTPPRHACSLPPAARPQPDRQTRLPRCRRTASAL